MKLSMRSLALAATAAAILFAAPALALMPGAGVVPQQSSAIFVAGTTVDEMPPGIRRAFIIGIQEQLQEHGYHVGPIDGIVGKFTKGAIRQYQRDAGLPVNGIATKELLDHLNFALPKVMARGKTAPPTPPAASSELVLDIQTGLQERGYYQGRLDGLIGPQTREAIIGFQTDADLDATGNVSAGLLEELQLADPSIQRF